MLFAAAKKREHTQQFEPLAASCLPDAAGNLLTNFSEDEQTGKGCKL